jgi:ABC-type antimicrobial peptide transport system permease subunit
MNTNDGGMSPLGKIAIDGVPRQFPSMVWYLAIDDRYFQAMGINVETGRPFSRDDRRGAPPVAIVSASLARIIGAGGPVLGRRIDALSNREARMEIVGTASDVVTNISDLEPLVIYQPLAQAPPRPYRNITVRAESVVQARRDVAAAIRQLNPKVTSTPMRTLEQRVAQQMAPQRLGATVLGALGVIAVLLTLLGIYVVSDSMASIRLREMGVRAALGASPRQLGTIVVAEMTRLVAIGLAAGGALAWLGAGTIRTFMFRVQPLDPTTLVLVASAMIALALAVSLRPALRVARVDLATVLRAE